ncbi:TPA: O-antigen ligase family protein [Streptococcus suis]
MQKLIFKLEYLLFQCTWIIILLPKGLQMILLAGMAVILWPKLKKTTRVDKVTFFFTLFIAIYICSFLMNLFVGDYSISRIFATVNSISIWVIGLVYFYAYSKNKVDKFEIMRYCFVNLSILIIFTLLYLLLPGNITIFGGRSLKGVDWINGLQTTRFTSFMEYPNLIVFFCFLQVPMAINYVEAKYNKLLSLFFLWLTFLPVYQSGSRAGMAIAILLIFYFSLYSIIKKNFLSILTILSGGIAVIYVLGYSENISNLISNILETRSGSTGARSELYRQSIERTWTISPLFGLGIRDMFMSTVPYGSHSTYIGIFYRTGLVGFLLFMVSMGNLVFHLWQRINLKLIEKLYLIGLFSFMVIEDLDGANWVVVLFFSIMAIYQNKQVYHDK